MGVDSMLLAFDFILFAFGDVSSEVCLDPAPAVGVLPGNSARISAGTRPPFGGPSLDV